MHLASINRRLVLIVVLCLCPAAASAQVIAKKTVEPIYRLTHNIAPNDSGAESDAETAVPDVDKIVPAPSAEILYSHPLDRAIHIAEEGLENMRQNVRDYKAIMVKRERINGELLDPQYMTVKIRNARKTDEGEVPFSIYMKFLKPKSIKGQEVIWVNGWNNNHIAAHGAGLKRFLRLNLDPNGSMAMKDNRHPIYEAGIENLVSKLLEKGTRDRAVGPCEVKYVEDTTVNGRKCTMIEVIHAEQKHPYEFHRAQVFIDQEMQIPVRYAAYQWPKNADSKPPLLEEYTYVKVELNVGLTNRDFDPNNPDYDYP